MRKDEKLPYGGARLEIVAFDAVDVIATSGEIGTSSRPQTNDGGWTEVS